MSSDDEPLIKANPRKTGKAVVSLSKKPARINATADSDSDDVPLIRPTSSKRGPSIETNTERDGARVAPSPTSGTLSATSPCQVISPAASDSDDEPLMPKIPVRKGSSSLTDDDDDDDPVLSTIKRVVKTEETDGTDDALQNASTPTPRRNSYAPRLLKATGFTSEYRSLNGLWTMNPAKTHDNATVYEKRNWASKKTVYLYYSSHGEQQGWWIGPDIGGDTAWVLNDQRASASGARPRSPLIRGWRVPFSGPADHRVTFTPMDHKSTVKELDTIILQHELKRKRQDSREMDALVSDENTNWLPEGKEKRIKKDENAQQYDISKEDKDSFLKAKQEDFVKQREKRANKWAKQLEKWALMRHRRKRRDIHLRPDEWRFREVQDEASSVGDDDSMFGDFSIDCAIGGVPEREEKDKRVDAIQARLHSVLAEVDKVFDEDEAK